VLLEPESFVTWDMFVSPFANDEILSSVSTHVIDLIVVMTKMFYENFFTRPFRSVNPHVYDVVT
jgi:hypothetical protein